MLAKFQAGRIDARNWVELAVQPCKRINLVVSGAGIKE
jgi:hypothetical protein